MSFNMWLLNKSLTKQRSLGRFQRDSAVPAFDLDRLVRVEVHRVLALGVEVAEKRALSAAEMEKAHRRADADVDPDVPGIDLVAVRPGLASALGVQRGGVAVLGAVDHLDGLVEVVDRRQTQHGPKDLRPGDLHVDRDALQQRRTEEVPLGVLGVLEIATIDDEVGSFADRPVDHSEDTLLSVGRDERSDVCLLVDSRTNYEVVDGVEQSGSELVVGVADADDHIVGEAALPRVAVHRADDVRHGFRQDRGVGDDGVVLRAALRLDAFARRGRGLVDVSGDRRRADERNARDIVVGEQRVDRADAAVDEVDDALGEAGGIDGLEDEL